MPKMVEDGRPPGYWLTRHKVGMKLEYAPAHVRREIGKKRSFLAYKWRMITEQIPLRGGKQMSEPSVGTVWVEVDGGCVQGVTGLPEGWNWDVVDWDNLRDEVKSADDFQRLQPEYQEAILKCDPEYLNGLIAYDERRAEEEANNEIVEKEARRKQFLELQKEFGREGGQA